MPDGAPEDARASVPTSDRIGRVRWQSALSFCLGMLFAWWQWSFGPFPAGAVFNAAWQVTTLAFVPTLVAIGIGVILPPANRLARTWQLAGGTSLCVLSAVWVLLTPLSSASLDRLSSAALAAAIGLPTSLWACKAARGAWFARRQESGRFPTVSPEGASALRRRRRRYAVGAVISAIGIATATTAAALAAGQPAPTTCPATISPGLGFAMFLVFSTGILLVLLVAYTLSEAIPHGRQTMSARRWSPGGVALGVAGIGIITPLMLCALAGMFSATFCITPA